MISELKKVRGLPWNGTAQNLKATIVTQQDQGPSGHRTCVLDDQGRSEAWVQRLAAVAVSVWDHTQKHVECDWKKQWPTIEQDPVETPVGPITEPATESQESAPVAQQEPVSSSSGPAAPMPTQNLQNEQMDSTDGVGNTRTQRAQRSAAKRDANK